MKRKIQVGVGLVVLGLGLTACGSQSSAIRAKPAAFTKAAAVSPPRAAAEEAKAGKSRKDDFEGHGAPVKGEKRVHGIGADIVPKVNKVTAFPQAEAEAKGMGDDLAKKFVGGHGAPTTVLATYTNVMGDVQPDGSMTPSVPSQEAWVLTWSGLPPSAVAGPASPEGSAPAPPPPAGVTCEFVMAISSATGETLDAFRNCTGP